MAAASKYLSTTGINGGVSTPYNQTPTGRRDFRARGQLQLVTPALKAVFAAAQKQTAVQSCLGFAEGRHNNYPSSDYTP